jgi:hypothetical protein
LRRFEIMRHWHVDRGIPFDRMISNFDGNWLHQTDWSYNCIAQTLFDGLDESVRSGLSTLPRLGKRRSFPFEP